MGGRSHRLRRRKPLGWILLVVGISACVALFATLLVHPNRKAKESRISVQGASFVAQPPPTAVATEVENPYAYLRARGKAKRVIAAGRSQLGVEYVYGAQPRDPDGLHRIGFRRARGGFDCSSFVAYVFEISINEWVSGHIAHTDQIWTQGGELPLTATPGETAKIIRGTDAHRPPGGYKVGDMILTRWGSGGFWGHVAIISDHGMALESLGDVHESAPISNYLTHKNSVGWVRVKALQA